MTSHLPADVLTLYARFGLPLPPVPTPLPPALALARLAHLHEELAELAGAIVADDLPATADALVDLVVLAIGTAHLLGLPFDACWAEVHRANLAKERGATRRGHGFDLRKPPGWAAPDHVPALRAAGWDPTTTK